VSITPEIQDPDYLYITTTSTVKYDSTKTSNTAATIKSLITNTIYQYGVTSLGLFSNEFRYSPLIKKIDETETAIESSLNTVKLRRTFPPTLNTASSYTLKYSNEIYHPFTNYVGSIDSTQFSHYDDDAILRIACALQDSNGIMQVYRTSGADKIVVANNVGTVTYGSGKIALSNFKPIIITDGTANVSVTVALASSDITPQREQILLISNSDIVITMSDTAGTGTDTAVTSTSASGATSGGSSGGGGTGSSY